LPSTEAATRRIFISYRRGDSQAAAGRLYDQLLRHFQREQLFIDVDAMEPGIDFVNMLDEQVTHCGAFIAVIGPTWLTAEDRNGKRRLDSPTDYVRVEIESALRRDIRVIPVLVDGASMPQDSDLPAPLQPLARRNAVEIAHHRFAADCDGLAHSIERAIGRSTPPPIPIHPVAPPPPPLQAGDKPKLSWPQVLFSFAGRIPRKQFAIGMLGTIGVFIAIYFAIIVTVETILGGAESEAASVARAIKLMESRIGTIVNLIFMWPTWALTLKRLHDLGHGWNVMWIFVTLDLVSTVLDLAGRDAISANLALLTIGLMLMLAVIKGTPGANRYGSDPLARA
jgi:uncharacterized membrane protein YhaH (DUF805 family)